jgi:predicted RNase H-like HicB family nuclease
MSSTYTVIVYDAEEGGYWAEVAELPGCVSQGDSLDELERNIREAIQSWLQAKHDGEPESPRHVRTWNLHIQDEDLITA